MEKFPMFNLPSLVTDDILKRVTPSDLFSFSLHSEEAKNIVRHFARSHHFHLDIHPENSSLYFKYKNTEEEDQLLLISESLYGTSGDYAFNFKGRSKWISADIELKQEDTPTVTAFWNTKKKSESLSFMIEYMSSVFPNLTVTIDFVNPKKWVIIGDRRAEWPKKLYKRLMTNHVKSVKSIKQTLKKLELKIDYYNDYDCIYNYNQLKELIKTCKSIDIHHVTLTNREMNRLFNQWMEAGNVEYIYFFSGCHIKLENVTLGHSTTMGNDDEGDYFEVTRSNGIKAKVRQDNGEFTFKII